MQNLFGKVLIGWSSVFTSFNAIEVYMALSNRSSAHIKHMAAEFFKKVTHKAIDLAKYLSMTFFFVRDSIFAICDVLLLK